MADHVFTALTAHVYPEAKDAQGRNIGQVEPGEIRDTDGPLDHQWREATDEDRAAWEQAQAAPGEPGELAGDEGGNEAASESEAEAGGQADGPQPAAPAVIPGA